MAARAKELVFEGRDGPEDDLFASHTVDLIGFACGIGASDADCARGPEIIKQMGVLSALFDRGVNARWKCFLKTSLHEQDKNLRIDYLSMQLRILAQIVSKTIRQHKRFAVIGGDHSCAIGTWSGAARQIQNLGPVGLVWIDAHMDSHTFISSQSGTVQGMPLACLLGYGDRRLTSILSSIPKISPKHVCLVGVRSFEADEAKLLRRLGVRTMFMQEINERGLSSCMEEAIAIASQGTAGFGLSIDLDSVDPSDAPGVNTPEYGGIGKAELLAALEMFPHQEKYLGIEVAELNPALDRDQMTAKLAIEVITAGLVKDHKYEFQRAESS